MAARGSGSDQRELIRAAQRQVEQLAPDTALQAGPGSRGDELEVLRRGLPDYEWTDEIHRGGQGVVYRAFHPATGRDVAIKVWRSASGAGERARFEREVRTLARLAHPGIVTVHDSGCVAGRFYCVMDYVVGEDLDREIAEQRLDLRKQVELCHELAEAVQAAHLRGILHRDLKPSNIRVDAEGHPRVLDFGLAKWQVDDPAPAEATRAGAFVGSLPWASPEQVDGKPLDLRSDVYSLGVVFYQLLTGRFPYPVQGSWHDVHRRITEQVPARPRGLRRALDLDVETILLKCLSKDPERRYQSAAEVARDLANYRAGRAIDARRDSAWYVVRKLLGRHRLLTSAAGLLLALLAAFSVHLAVSRERLRELLQQRDTLLHVRDLQRMVAVFEQRDATTLRTLVDQVPAAQRGFVDGWFRERLARRRGQQSFAGDSILAAALDPRGRYVAVGTWRGRFALLDPSGGRVIRDVAADLADVQDLAIDPRGAFLAVAGSGGVDVFDAETLEHRERLEVSPLESGPLERVRATEHRILAATIDGEVLEWTGSLADGFLPSARLRCSHPAQGARSEQFRELTGVRSVALQPDARRVATVGRSTLRVWSVDVPEPLRSFSLLRLPGSLPLQCVALDSRGEHLALGTGIEEGSDARLLVFEVASGRTVLEIAGLPTSLTDLCFTADDEFLFAAGRDGAVRSYDWKSGLEREVLLTEGGSLRRIVAGPGEQLVALDGSVHLLEHEGSVRRLAGDPAQLGVDAEGRFTLSARAAAPGLAWFSPTEGGASIVATEGGRAAVFRDGQLGVHAATDGALLCRPFLRPGAEARSLAFVDGGDVLAVGTADGSIHLFDSAFGDPVLSFLAHVRPVAGLCFDAETGRLASLDEAGELRVFASRSTP